jgi:hypothetical protein
LILEESAYQLVNQSDGCSWIGAIYFVLFALGVKEDFCFLRFEVFGERLSELFFKFFHHGDPAPGGREVDF